MILSFWTLIACALFFIWAGGVIEGCFLVLASGGLFGDVVILILAWPAVPLLLWIERQR